jgi:hypothetical protein
MSRLPPKNLPITQGDFVCKFALLLSMCAAIMLIVDVSRLKPVLVILALASLASGLSALVLGRVRFELIRTGRMLATSKQIRRSNIVVMIATSIVCLLFAIT